MYASGKFFVAMTIVGAAVGAGRAVPANRPRMIATPNETANATFAALLVCFLITNPPLQSSGFGPPTPPQRPGSEGFRERQEPRPAARRERHDAQRRADHALQPVARLVHDHVSEPAA